MFFSLFYRKGLGVTSGDLRAPYAPDKDGRVGFWELGGSAIAFGDYILLSPAIQNYKGSIWTNLEIPSGDWKVQFNMAIPEGDGGGFGIWFVDKYGMDGDFFGGPTDFNGFAFIGEVKFNQESSRTELLVSIIQNDGTQKADVIGKVKIPLHHERPFTFSFDFNKQKVTVFRIDEDEGKIELLSDEIRSPLEDLYLGITAQSGRRASTTILNAVRFILDHGHTMKSSDNVSYGHNKPSARVHQDHFYPLRNPNFNEILKQFQSDSDRPKGVGVLWEIILEVARAVQSVATFSDVNDLLVNTILPVAEKMQKRTVTTVERLKQTRYATDAALEYTSNVLKTMNESVAHNIIKADAKITNLASLIAYEAGQGVDSDGSLSDLVKDVKTSGVSTWLLTTAFAETVALLFALVIYNTSCAGKQLSLC